MKLTTKLLVAFLLVSMVSSGIIVLFTRVATNREFEKFVSDRYKAELVEELGKYYQQNQTWAGVDKTFRQFGRDPNNHDYNRPLFFSIAEPDGRIVVAGAGRKLGEVLNAEELSHCTPIQAENKTVGVLLLAMSPDRNPLEDEFLRRLNGSIFLSAIGTVIVALFLGIILSRSITRPIRELTKATHAMADGNLNQKVKVRSRDEIGELGESFNKMSSDLSRSFNLRKQMTADIAHELRTPLSLIIGHAEGVHDGVLEPTHENFEIIREEAERLEKLVNDLRTLSLADAGELSVDFQALDVNNIISDVYTHYISLFNQQRITLNLKPGPVILRANLDPSRFTQVLNNILDNALRYTPADGVVDIETKLVDNKIQISVQDNGEGVNPEEAARLFDRFYRADESRTRDDGGSGLGLAIAKSIVEMHKGRIWAESEKGKGLKVLIELPNA
ncbi:MAG: HAMP domain-containing protein [Anaerolineales bacterium]|nr:HAMP domain-containing protein [Anaerolineales bacterium]